MDIYFDKKYGELYEEKGISSLVNYSLTSELGTIEYNFLKRKIVLESIELEEDWFDIITPYGYGGPCILNSRDTKKLVAEFEKEFSKYCKENKIVSEFVTFNPLVGNAEDFKDIYDLNLGKYTVGTDLKYGLETLNKEFSKSTRKQIRGILKNDNISLQMVKSPKSLKEFKEIYYQTMERREASKFYYFDEKYFENLLLDFQEKILLCNVLYKEKIIASSLNLLSNKTIHVHLSGTNTDYLKYSPAYLLKYGVANWGIDNEFEMIHYGGGKTNQKDDSLFLFKKKFGKNTMFKLYYGAKIHNFNMYNYLTEISGSKDIEFFPKYRIKN